MSYFTRYFYVELKIQQDIRYPACTGYPAGYRIRFPAFRLAEYPAKSVSGASLLKKLTFLPCLAVH
jgi:hypothetical protein